MIGYWNQLLNPYSEQWTLGAERRLGSARVLSVDYVGSHTLRISKLGSGLAVVLPSERDVASGSPTQGGALCH